jgi:hypothetical protein
MRGTIAGLGDGVIGRRRNPADKAFASPQANDYVKFEQWYEKDSCK